MKFQKGHKVNLGITRSKETRLKMSLSKRGVKHPNYKGFKFVRGYKYILMPEHPFSTKRGYIYEHRLVCERMLNRYLTPEEVPHHISSDNTDNRPENIHLFPSQSKHISYHNLKNKPILISNLL